jgi:hypothetical protein
MSCTQQQPTMTEPTLDVLDVMAAFATLVLTLVGVLWVAVRESLHQVQRQRGGSGWPWWHRLQPLGWALLMIEGAWCWAGRLQGLSWADSLVRPLEGLVLTTLHVLPQLLAAAARVATH